MATNPESGLGASETKLERAYDLIREERLDEAVAILQPILLAEPENADAWWLMANAATEPEDAREALHRVLEFNPQHAEAREFLDQLNEMLPPVPEAAAGTFDFGVSADFNELYGDTTTQPPVPEAPPMPEELPEILQAEAEELQIEPLVRAEEGATPALDLGTLFDMEEGEAETAGEAESLEDLPDFDLEAFEAQTMAGTATRAMPRRRPLRRFLLIALTLLVIGLIVVGVVVVTQPAAPRPVAQPTEVPTLAVSDTMQVALDGAQQVANQQSQALGGPAVARLETSPLGSTLILRVCRPAGTDLSQAITLAMEMAANAGLSVQDELDAVGANLINCDRGDVLLHAVAPVAQAAAFATRDITLEEFRASWQWTP